jgi:hypothetical protein
MDCSGASSRVVESRLKLLIRAMPFLFAMAVRSPATSASTFYQIVLGVLGEHHLPR